MTIQVVLVDLGGMLKEIVREILTSEPDVAVTELEGGEEALSLLAEGVNVVILAESSPNALPLASRLLVERPHVRVLSLTSSGRECHVYELRPQRVPLGEVSPEALVAAVREAAERSR